MNISEAHAWRIYEMSTFMSRFLGKQGQMSKLSWRSIHSSAEYKIGLWLRNVEPLKKKVSKPVAISEPKLIIRFYASLTTKDLRSCSRRQGEAEEGHRPVATKSVIGRMGQLWDGASLLEEGDRRQEVVEEQRHQEEGAAGCQHCHNQYSGNTHQAQEERRVLAVRTLDHNHSRRNRRKSSHQVVEVLLLDATERHRLEQERRSRLAADHNHRSCRCVRQHHRHRLQPTEEELSRHLHGRHCHLCAKERPHQ